MADNAGLASLDWGQIAAGISAVGAFGTAAFGMVEVLGKSIVIPWPRQTKSKPKNFQHWGRIGLPYAGFGAVSRAIRPLIPALRCAYGEDFLNIIADQYRADRSAGAAPDTIRQGVRLGLPFLKEDPAERLIAQIWHMSADHTAALASALRTDLPVSNQTPPAPAAPAAGVVLAGRFAAALDARIGAAFDIAEEQYQAAVKTAAAFFSVLLACLFNAGLTLQGEGYPWPLAVGIGIIAVPLAPVAKDLSSYLQNALTSFKAIGGKK